MKKERFQALLHAVHQNDAQAVESVLRGSDIPEETLAFVLVDAFYQGKNAAAGALVNLGVAPDHMVLHYQLPRSTAVLTHAVAAGNVEGVDLFVRQGAWLDAPQWGNDEGGLLHVACARGHLKMAALLLEQGMDPNQMNEKGRTPLFCALSELDPDKNLALVSLLLDHGADPMAMAARSYLLFQEALTHAPYDTINVLIQGCPALILQAIDHDVQHAFPSLWETALSRHHTDGRIEKLLLDMNYPLSLPHAVAFETRVHLQTCSSDLPPALGSTRKGILLYAALLGRKDTVEELLRRGADPCERDTYGRKPGVAFIQGMNTSPPSHVVQVLKSLLAPAKLTPVDEEQAWDSLVQGYCHNNLTPEQGIALSQALMEVGLDPRLTGAHGLTPRQVLQLSCAEDDILVKFLEAAENALHLNSSTTLSPPGTRRRL